MERLPLLIISFNFNPLTHQEAYGNSKGRLSIAQGNLTLLWPLRNWTQFIGASNIPRNACSYTPIGQSNNTSLEKEIRGIAKEDIQE